MTLNEVMTADALYSAVAFREVVLSDFALMSTDVRENSSYIKSFAVDKLLAAAAPKL